jgi:D-alanyl-D-alanine carboxypeptidase/D-alanyl-D-alanine-endopeptidase (penicillin-binding protein 4)
MKKFLFPLLCIVFIVWYYFPTNSQKKSKVSILTAIENLKNDHSMQNASWGFYAYNISQQKVVASFQENLSLIPASSLKILACGYALMKLGPEFKFQTTLGYQGSLENGILQGNLVVIGSGDPTLGTDRVNGGLSIDAFLTQWANAVKNKGIKKIQGNLVIDVSCVTPDAIPPNWLWSDIGNYYGSGFYGVNIRENHYGIIFRSGSKSGDSTQILYTFPKFPDLVIENSVLTGHVGSTDDAYIYGSPESNFRRVIGTIPPNQQFFEVKGALPNPPYQMGRFLLEKLNSFGITLSGKILVTYQPQKLTQTLDVHYSPKLLNIVYTTLHLSHNLMAEALLQASFRKKNQPMSLISALEGLKNALDSAKIDTKGLFISDGSGLSRTNIITPKQMVEILKFFDQSVIREHFEKCLPVIGESNSFVILNQLIENKGKIKMKSGYMSRIRSFAGYAYNSQNEKIAFAFIVNYYNCSNIESLYKMAPVIDALAN